MMFTRFITIAVLIAADPGAVAVDPACIGSSCDVQDSQVLLQSILAVDKTKQASLATKAQVATAELNCDKLPSSMNGRNHPKGCPGAVWWGGAPAKKYCDGDGDKYPWWKKCCHWTSDGTCAAKATCSTFTCTTGVMKQG